MNESHMVKETGIADAIRAVGTQELMASAMGVTQQIISVWAKQGYVPLKRVTEVEQLSGIPRNRLVHPRISGLFNL